MAKSILQNDKECYLCRRMYNLRTTRGLEEHHILFGRGRRELSERYGTPVILRPTTRVDHGCSSIDVPADLGAVPRHAVPGFEKDPRWVIFPPLSHRAHERMAADLAQIAREFCESPFNRLEEHVRDDYELYLGVACSGDSRGYVREALARLEDAARAAGCELPSYRLLEVGTPYPFPDGLGRDFLLGLADALVVEELEPGYERPTADAPELEEIDLNLIASANGEIFETSDMYPGFIAKAQEEGNDKAVQVFTKAKLAEAVHAELYLQAYNNIDAADDDSYFLCPGCGYIEKGSAAPEKCPICGAPAKVFTQF